MKTPLVVMALGSLALLFGAVGYRAFARQRFRKQYRVDNVSEQWLAEQRRER